MRISVPASSIEKGLDFGHSFINSSWKERRLSTDWLAPNPNQMGRINIDFTEKSFPKLPLLGSDLDSMRDWRIGIHFDLLVIMGIQIHQTKQNNKFEGNAHVHVESYGTWSPSLLFIKSIWFGPHHHPAILWMNCPQTALSNLKLNLILMMELNRVSVRRVEVVRFESYSDKLCCCCCCPCCKDGIWP